MSTNLDDDLPRGNYEKREKHVFVSYAHEDGDFAELLSLRVRYAFKVWNDFDSIGPGEKWQRKIEQGIRNSFAIIVVMSPEAKASEFVTYEWSYALGVGIPVIPVMRLETELHPQLAELQYLKFIDRDTRPWDQLMNRLHDLSEQATVSVETESIAEAREAFDTKTVVRNAVAALGRGNPSERLNALINLGEILPDNSAQQVLEEALGAAFRDVRFNAAIVLAKAKQDTPAIRKQLKNALSEGDNDMRTRAAHAFYALGDSAVDDLCGLLQSDDAYTRAVASATLGWLKADEAIPPLIKALDDKDATVRAYAAAALSNYGTRAAEAIDNLKGLLADTENTRGLGTVQETAKRALQRIDPAKGNN